MAMDSTVPPKDHHYISLLYQRCPLRTCSALERGNTPGYIPRPEDSSGAHVRRKFYQKLRHVSSAKGGGLHFGCTVILTSQFIRSRRNWRVEEPCVPGGLCSG